MIEEFLASIEIDKSFDWLTGKEKTNYIFCGDGSGDFEKRKKDCTQEVLSNYIASCKEQKKLAEEILKIKRSKRTYEKVGI